MPKLSIHKCHEDGMPISVEPIQHQVTSIPQVRTQHGVRNIPTKYLVKHNSLWRRVWIAKDGSFYIVSAYLRVKISITED